MTSNRPYLVRAIHAWVLDNGLTPHLVVDANASGVSVPQRYVEDGKIVLNISPSAVRDLDLGNQHICFSARFTGAPFDVVVPTGAVLAIYARENGKGLAFPDEEPDGEPPSEPPDDPGEKPRAPSLRVVK